MRRMWLLVVVLFAVGAVPAGADGGLSPGCEALDGRIVVNGVVIITGLTFLEGEVVSVAFSGEGAGQLNIRVDGQWNNPTVFTFPLPDTATYSFNGLEDGVAVVTHLYGTGTVAGVVSCTGPPDADGDGVLDADDVCPDTDLEGDEAPDGLKRNRIWSDADGNFFYGDEDSTATGYTVVDTGGCSASQIIDQAEVGPGHDRFGISRSVFEDYVFAEL